MEIRRVLEEDLKELANEQGPQGAATAILERLRQKRAKDRQFFVWRVGRFCFVGPMPDAVTEAAIVELAEAEDSEER